MLKSPMSRPEYEITMGAEVHVQVLNSDCKTKAFSAALATNDELSPNTNLDYIDYGLPGSLPVFNMAIARAAVRAGHALQCKIHKLSIFDDKNYGYVDMSCGRQITQFFSPIATGGKVPLVSEKTGIVGEIDLNRIHIEQDAGKNFHDINPEYTAVDFNRAGIGLLEIVTEPCFTSIDQVPIFVKSLRTILRHVNVCNCDMEKGEMRVDLSISVKPKGSTVLGTRVEVKNVNSIKDMREAAEYEFHRQVSLLNEGGRVLQETRLFDIKAGVTIAMRNKEDADEYLYIHDYNLPPLELSDEFIAKQRVHCVLPHDRCKYLVEEYNLKWADAYIIENDPGYSSFFANVCNFDSQTLVEAPLSREQILLAAKWMVGELFGLLANSDRSIENVNPVLLREIVLLIDSNVISGKVGKEVLKEAFEDDKSPKGIVKERGLQQVSDVGAVTQVISEVFDAYPNDVQRYKNGETKLFGFFVGAVTKRLKGVNIQVLRDELIKMLGQ